jgi:alpha-galactosidase
MDMLEVGNEGLDFYENQSHFALWAIMNSPLMLGNDIRKISKETLGIITDRDIIALNQDKLGVQGFRYGAQGGIEIFAKPLADGQWAFLFLNRSDRPAELLFDWNANPVKDDIFGHEIALSAINSREISDLYAKKELGSTQKPLKAKLVKHQSLVVRVY